MKFPSFFERDIGLRPDGKYNVWEFLPETFLSEWPIKVPCHVGRWTIVAVVDSMEIAQAWVDKRVEAMS